MCQLCEENMKNVRVLLAAKIVGLLPQGGDTELDDTIGHCLREHAIMVARVDESQGQAIMECSAIHPRLATGIRKALPTIPIKERFIMALAAGAIKL